MMGGHLVKSWSRTQDSVTLGSAEAELVALGKLAMEILGLASALFVAKPDSKYLSSVGTTLFSSSNGDGALHLNRFLGNIFYKQCRC